MPLTSQAYRKTEFTHRIGLHSSRPSASDVLAGTLYFSIDAGILERSNGVSWDLYGPRFNSGNSIPGIDGIDGIDNEFLSLSQQINPIVIDSTATGTQNNWEPGLNRNTLIIWHGASDITVTGFSSGQLGQTITLKNTGTKVAYFSYNSGSSSAGNKLFNLITSGVTPVSIGGHITYQYDGTQWQLITHSQGSSLTPVFSAADYTGSGAMTVTADSGDITSNEYYVNGNQVTWFLNFNGLTTGGVADVSIKFTLPNGWTAITTIVAITRMNDNGVGFIAGILFVVAGQNYIGFQRIDGANWVTPQTNAAQMVGTIIFTIS